MMGTVFGSGAELRFRGGTDEVELDSCGQRRLYTQPGLNLSTTISDSERLSKRDNRHIEFQGKLHS